MTSSSSGAAHTKITLGHDVWLGHGVIVVPGVTIGTGAVVGSGAVVTHDHRAKRGARQRAG